MKNKIHSFRFKGLNLIYDIGSGTLHQVDDIAWDIIKNRELNKDSGELKDKYNIEEISEAEMEVEKLQEKGILFSEPVVFNSDYQLANAPLKALCLNVAHDCDIRCKYCFAATGGYGGKRKLMAFETGKKAIDFLLKHSGNRKNLDIDFFGGEPMLNKVVVKELIKYGKKMGAELGKTINYTVTTNCLQLDDLTIEFFEKEKVNLVLSLDGREDINDMQRCDIKGNGTYTRVIGKILKIAADRNDTSYYVRGTYTKNNLDFSEDVKNLVSLGINNISLEPVVLKEDHPLSIKEEDLDTLFNQYDYLADFYIERIKSGKPFIFFHFALDLDKGPCLPKRLTGCGAGREYLAITPDGDIYPCHQFVGMEKFLLGNLEKIHEEYDSFLNNPIKNAFYKTHIFSKENCPSCWARFLCSGGCHANAYIFNNSLNKPYDIACKLQMKRIEISLGIKAVLQGGNNEI